MQSIHKKPGWVEGIWSACLRVNGNPVRLTKAQRAYRAGYLDHGKDSARAYNAKKGNGNSGQMFFPAPAAKPKRTRKRSG